MKYHCSVAKKIKVSCWWQSEDTCWCSCVRCARRLANRSGSVVRTSPPKSCTISTVSLLFYGHFEASSSKSIKENIFAEVPLLGWKNNRLWRVGGATFQLVVVGVKLRLTNFCHT